MAVEDSIQFQEQARRRWRQLGKELQVDVADLDQRGGGALFAEPDRTQYRVTNAASGLELSVVADFVAETVRYQYTPVADLNAGTPEGGILSMRECEGGTVEFYSADRRLTSEETRRVLLEPLLPSAEAA
jgi:hypothetical protein